MGTLWSYSEESTIRNMVMEKLEPAVMTWDLTIIIVGDRLRNEEKSNELLNL